MSLNFYHKGKWSVIKFMDPAMLDMHTIDRVKQQIINHISQIHGDANVIINFKGTQYASSQVISLLLAVKDKAVQKNGSLRLCECDGPVLDVLKLTKLDHQFTIMSTETEAVQ